MIRILAQTFWHQVVRRHEMTHLIERSQNGQITGGWMKCSCGRCWRIG